MENKKESETPNKLGGLDYSSDLWASYKVRSMMLFEYM